MLNALKSNACGNVFLHVLLCFFSVACSLRILAFRRLRMLQSYHSSCSRRRRGSRRRSDSCRRSVNCRRSGNRRGNRRRIVASPGSRRGRRNRRRNAAIRRQIIRRNGR